MPDLLSEVKDSLVYLRNQFLKSISTTIDTIGHNSILKNKNKMMIMVYSIEKQQNNILQYVIAGKMDGTGCACLARCNHIK
ncbi:MAG: hypothetical protein FD166_2099 [Bacteroidetes bacterium]|nr:MAG: hypothetical protein FD166_2099 [Bacteroidota bacterium]